jgi:hypothetical protein
MKKAILFFFLSSLFLNLKAQSLSFEVGNMYCPTNTKPKNQYLAKNISKNRYFHFDYSINLRNNLSYIFGYSFYQPKTGVKFSPLPNSLFTGWENIVVTSHLIQFGLKKSYQIINNKVSLMPIIFISGRVNWSDISSGVELPQANGRSFKIQIDSKSKFHIVPSLNTKIAFKLNHTFKIYATVGYLHSFNKSTILKYEVFETNGSVFTGTGFLTGTNWHYGIGICFNPKTLNK